MARRRVKGIIGGANKAESGDTTLKRKLRREKQCCLCAHPIKPNKTHSAALTSGSGAAAAHKHNNTNGISIYGGCIKHSK